MVILGLLNLYMNFFFVYVGLLDYEIHCDIKTPKINSIS